MHHPRPFSSVFVDCAFLGFAFSLYIYRCFYYPSLCVFFVGFLTFSRLFTWCFVAGKTSLTPSHVRLLCPNPGALKNAQFFIRLRRFASPLNHRRRLSYFRSSRVALDRDIKQIQSLGPLSISRRACRHLAGSGSAMQVRVPIEE